MEFTAVKGAWTSNFVFDALASSPQLIKNLVLKSAFLQIHLCCSKQFILSIKMITF